MISKTLLTFINRLQLAWNTVGETRKTFYMWVLISHFILRSWHSWTLTECSFHFTILLGGELFATLACVYAAFMAKSTLLTNIMLVVERISHLQVLYVFPSLTESKGAGLDRFSLYIFAMMADVKASLLVYLGTEFWLRKSYS